MNCAREPCRRWAFVFAKSLDRAPLSWRHRIRRGRGTGLTRAATTSPVILCVDILRFHIGLEPSLELAHQRQ
jgi:hypothetical protein